MLALRLLVLVAVARAVEGGCCTYTSSPDTCLDTTSATHYVHKSEKHCLDSCENNVYENCAWNDDLYELHSTKATFSAPVAFVAAGVIASFVGIVASSFWIMMAGCLSATPCYKTCCGNKIVVLLFVGSCSLISCSVSYRHFFDVLGSQSLSRRECSHIDGCYACNTWDNSICSACFEGFYGGLEWTGNNTKHKTQQSCKICPGSSSSIVWDNYYIESCDINTTPAELERKGRRIDQNLTSFFNNAKNGNLLALKKQVEENGVRLEAIDRTTGQTALTISALNHRIELVKYLLSSGANVMVVDSNGNTTLQLMKAQGRLTLGLLFRNKKKKIITLLEDELHRMEELTELTKLGQIFSNNEISLEKQMLHARNLGDSAGKMHIGVIDSSNEFILKNIKNTFFHAVQQGDEDYVRFVLKVTHSKGNVLKYATDVPMDSDDSFTGSEDQLFATSTPGVFESKQLTVDVNAIDKDGMTALMWSSAKGYIDIAQVLIDHRANVAATSADGQSAIKMALVNGHDSVVRLLNHRDKLWYARYVAGPLVSVLVLAITAYLSIPLCSGDQHQDARTWLVVLPFSVVLLAVLLMYLGDQDGDGDRDARDITIFIDESKNDVLETSELLSAGFILSGSIGVFVLVQILLLAAHAKYIAVQNKRTKEMREEAERNVVAAEMITEEAKEETKQAKDETRITKEEAARNAEMVREEAARNVKAAKTETKQAKEDARVAKVAADNVVKGINGEGYLELETKKIEDRRECESCYEEDIDLSGGVECHSDERHFLCDDCLSRHVTTSVEVDQLEAFKIRHSRIFCIMPECDQVYSDHSIVKHVNTNAFHAFQEAKIKIKEGQIYEEAKMEVQRLLEENVLQRNKRHVIEKILNLACPRCSRPLGRYLDFEGCCALKCAAWVDGDPNSCCQFCAYCFQDCGRDAHPHVKAMECPGNRGLWCNPVELHEVHKVRRTRMLKAFLAENIDTDVKRQELVVELARELIDVGLTPEEFLPN